MPVDDLATLIVSEKGLEGLTLSGGEPLLQAEPLLELVVKVRSVHDLGVILYTGFTLEELAALPDGDPRLLLFGESDTVVEGRYVRQLNDNLGGRGSSNQRTVHRTDRYRRLAKPGGPRSIEIRRQGDRIFMAGIPPAGILARLASAEGSS